MPSKDFMRVSKSTALWLFSLGRRLVREGTGNPGWDPRFLENLDNESVLPGFIHDIPGNSRLYAWCEACIMLIRTLVAIAADELGDNIPNAGPAHVLINALAQDDEERDDLSISNLSNIIKED